MASSAYTAKTLNTWHAHCDVIPEVFNFGVTRIVSEHDSSRVFGVLAQDLVFVVHSEELMAEIQKQLREASSGQLAYKKDSVTLQLADSIGAAGSAMIGSNVSTRLMTYLECLKAYMAKEYIDATPAEEKSSLPSVAPGAEASIPGVPLTPTQVGVRLYVKLPNEEKKVHDLAVAYGAIASGDEEPRCVASKDVTFKVNMCGFYMGKFYCNFRLIAPFNHRDEPEVLAKCKKGKATKPRRKVTEGEGSASAGAPIKKRKAVAAPTVKKPAVKKTLFESVTAEGQESDEDDEAEVVEEEEVVVDAN